MPLLFPLLLLTGLCPSGTIHAGTASHLLAPDPARVAEGTAFYEVFEPDQSTSETRLSLWQAASAELERSDSLRLDARIREYRHLVADLLDLYKDLRKVADKQQSPHAAGLSDACLDSVQFFLKRENQDSLYKVESWCMLSNTPPETSPPQPQYSNPFDRPSEQPRPEELFLPHVRSDSPVMTDHPDRPKIDYSARNWNVYRHLGLLQDVSRRFAVEIRKETDHPEAWPKWREWVVKRAGEELDGGEFLRANRLYRLLVSDDLQETPTLRALLSWTSLRSGDVYPSEEPWLLPPVSVRELAQPSDTLLRATEKVFLDLSARALEKGRFDQAHRHLQRIDPSSAEGPSSTLLQALLHRLQADHKAERHVLEHAASLSSRDFSEPAKQQYAQILEALGDLYAEQGESQAAVDVWQRVDKKAPNYAQATLKAAWVALGRGNRAAASRWAREVQKDNRETLIGWEASTLSALAEGNREGLLDRLDQLRSLDTFLIATRHLEAAEGMLDRLNRLRRPLLQQGTEADFAEFVEIQRLVQKLQTAAAEACSTTLPGDLVWDGPAVHGVLHPFEAEQLRRVEVREAELIRVHRQLEALEDRIPNEHAPVSHPDRKWKERVETARLIRDRQIADEPEPFRAADWFEPLERARRTLRVAVLFEGERLVFAPESVPAGERLSMAHHLDTRSAVLSGEKDVRLADAIALGQLWRGDLLRLAAWEASSDSLRAVADKVYRIIDTLACGNDLKALALDRRAALALEQGEPPQLQRIRDFAESVVKRFPGSPVVAHAELLAAQSWMLERRPQLDEALVILETARLRPGTDFEREALFLAGWCSLRLHEPDRASAIKTLDRAAGLPLPAPSHGDRVSHERIRSHAIQELAGAFTPPLVGTPKDGFSEAEEHFVEKWSRINAYGFEFYWKLGDLYLNEIGDEDAAGFAFEICRTHFPENERQLLVDLSAIRLQDKQQGDPDSSFAKRLALAGRWRQAEVHETALDSLVSQRLIEAISLAAAEVKKQADSSWVKRLNQAADLLQESGLRANGVPQALFLRAATLERFGPKWETSSRSLEQYRDIVHRFPESEVVRPSLERAFVLLLGILDAPSDGREVVRLSPSELTHLALTLADRFPDDPRTPGLLLHAGAHHVSDASTALLDTITVRYPKSDAALSAWKLWFKRHLESRRYEDVTRRALGLLAESPERRLREVAAASYAEASWHMAQAHAKGGRVDDALRLYRRGADVGKGTDLAPTLLYEAGLLAAEHKQSDLAKASFQELVDWYPDSPHAASASFNLALTLGHLKGRGLHDSPGEAEPGDIAVAFEEAYLADSSSTYALNFLANAAESYRLAGQQENELRLRITLMERFPDAPIGYANTVRAVTLSRLLENDASQQQSCRHLVQTYPDSAEAIVAHLHLGLLERDKHAFERAIALQDSLVKAGRPGLPAYADAARVGLLDLRASRWFELQRIDRLLPEVQPRNPLPDKAEWTEQVKEYGAVATLPSTAGVVALGHLAVLEAAQARAVVSQVAFDATNPGGTDVVAQYEKALQTSFSYNSRALEAISRAVQQLEQLRKSSQSFTSNSGKRQGVDPFGFDLLEHYLEDRERPEETLREWVSSLRSTMASQVFDAAHGYVVLAQRESGDPLDRLLLRIEALRNIVTPRLDIALSLLLKEEESTVGRKETLGVLFERLPALLQEEPLQEILESEWRPRTEHLLKEVKGTNRLTPASLQKLQASADSLNDLQDALVTLTDEGTLLLAMVHDSLVGRGIVDTALDSLLLERAAWLIQSAQTFNRTTEWCGRTFTELESMASVQSTEHLQLGQHLLKDQQRAWREGALRILESIWVLIDLERYANQRQTLDLARELVQNDPAGYASLFDLQETRSTRVTDANWYYLVRGEGVAEQVTIEEGRWREPNPGEVTPGMVHASFPGDTLVAETVIAVEGLVVAATLEITASCPYEVFVNGSYAAEGMFSPDLSGEPEVWELRTLLDSGDNSVRIQLAEDRPIGLMARIIWTTIPLPEPGMPIRTDSGHGGRE